MIADVASLDLKLETEFLYKKLRSITQQTADSAKMNYKKEIRAAEIMGTTVMNFTLLIPVKKLDLPPVRAQKKKCSPPPSNPRDPPPSDKVTCLLYVWRSTCSCVVQHADVSSPAP